MIPRVILYNAISLDGQTVGFTPELGQFYGLLSTWNEDAILAGSDTMLAGGNEVPDDSREPLHNDEKKPETAPLLFIVDSRGRVRCWNYLRNQPYWRGAVALCSGSTPEEYLEYLKNHNVDTIIAGGRKVDIKTALHQMSEKYGVKTVRVESGGVLNGVLLRASLVDEVSVLVYPVLVGSAAGHNFFHSLRRAAGNEALKLRLIHSKQLENEVIWLRYQVLK